MEQQKENHNTDVLFTLALFCVFTFCVLAVVTMGANVYNRSVDQMESNFDRRTSVSYIAAKLRQGDESGKIAVSSLEGIPALILTEEIDGASYTTWIYCHDGLREIFTLTELTPAPADGQVIMAMESLDVTSDGNGLLHIVAAMPGGDTETLLYAPRCAQG